MVKKKRLTPPKEPINDEASTIETEPLVSLESEVIPDSPELYAEKQAIEEAAISLPVEEEPSVVEDVTEKIADGMIKVQVILGTVGVVGLGSYQKGDTFLISEDLVAGIDPKFIKIL